jgi:hypothetical protein
MLIYAAFSQFLRAGNLSRKEHVAADLIEQPEPEAHAIPNTMARLRASVRQLTGDLQVRTKERDDARAALARTKFLLSASASSFLFRE